MRGRPTVMKPVVKELMKRTTERSMMTILERDLLRKAVAGAVDSFRGSVVVATLLGLRVVGGLDINCGGDGDGSLCLNPGSRVERGSSSIALRG